MKINSRHEIRGEKKKTRVVQQLPKTGFAKRRASEKETAVWTRLISFELFFFFCNPCAPSGLGRRQFLKKRNRCFPFFFSLQKTFSKEKNKHTRQNDTSGPSLRPNYTTTISTFLKQTENGIY